METENEIMNSIHFDSIQEIIDYDINDIMPFNRSLYSQSKNRYLGEKSVPTCPRASDCYPLALDGDHILYENYCKRYLEQLEKSINVNDYLHLTNANKRKRVKRDHGNELDIHKVYQGQIDKAWDSTMKVVDEQRIKFVTIFLGIGENWDVDGIDSIWNCVVALKLADIIERSGKNVQIIVGSCVTNLNREKRYSTVSFMIKRYNERLAPERLAAMSHLGFHRSFTFCSRLTSKYQCLEGLGSQIPLTSTELLPLNIQEEIALGHTKALVVKSSLDHYSAIERVKNSLVELTKTVY